VRIFAALPPKIVSHVRLAEGTARDIAVFDVTIADESGRILIEIAAFCMTRVTSGIGANAASSAAMAGRVPLTRQAGSRAAALADELLTQGLTTQEGLEALTRVLQSPTEPRVGVSTIELAPVLAQMAAWRRTPTSSAKEGHAREATGDALLAFDDDIEREIGRMWVDLLGVSAVGPNDNFFEAGGHSLLAVRLLARIERTFKCTIPLHALFSAGTVRDLAGRVRAATSRDAAGQETEPDDDLPLIAVPREQLRLSKDTLDKPHGR
jgi:acyl carrier protein